MKNKFYYLIQLGFIVLINGCFEAEGTLEPTGIEEGYILPQGNNDFDDRIMEYYTKYGTCLLYKFNDKDVYWTPTAWKDGQEGTWAEGAKEGFIVSPAEEQYIPLQLNLIEDCLFNFFNDNFLTKFLPYKMMLCSSVKVVKSGAHPDLGWGYWGTEVGAYFSYDNVSINYANESILSLTDNEKLEISNYLVKALAESMVENGLSNPIDIPGFLTAVSYNNTGSASTVSASLALGIFPPANTGNAQKDLKNILMMMISCPENYLTKETPIGSEWTYTEVVWEGILNPLKDVNGLIKKRYDIVREYFIQNYNIDLQSIGNRFNK